MELTHIEDLFTDIGGQFLTSAFDLREKLEKVNCLLFDWDGVFNDGRPTLNESSTYSAIATTGLDVLRFGFWLAHGKMPKMAIITGEKNPQVLEFAEKLGFEHFYFNCKNKAEALAHFKKVHSVENENIAYFFDDILDIPLAREVAVRLAVSRACNPVFMEYLEKNGLADYFSSCEGQENAVREFSEMILCLLGQHFNVMEKRANFDQDYQDYRERRTQIKTESTDCLPWLTKS